MTSQLLPTAQTGVIHDCTSPTSPIRSPLSLSSSLPLSQSSSTSSLMGSQPESSRETAARTDRLRESIPSQVEETALKGFSIPYAEGEDLALYPSRYFFSVFHILSDPSESERQSEKEAPKTVGVKRLVSGTPDLSASGIKTNGENPKNTKSLRASSPPKADIIRA